MNPEELAKLASLLADEIKRERAIGELHADLAAMLSKRYVMFERTEPQMPKYCDECGFSGGAAGHHPRCSKFDKYRTWNMKTLGGIMLIAAIVLGVGLAIRSVMMNNVATPGEARERVEAMTYQKDSRTGLCFAVFCWQDETRSVSYVPCTPEVVARIGR